MLPCPTCACHIRPGESLCPHCGAAQRPTACGVGVGVGVLAFVVTTLGLSACSSPSPSGDDGMSVTSASPTETGEDTGATMTTMTTTATATMGEDSSTDTGDEATNSLSFVAPTDNAALYGICDVLAQDCPEGEKCVPYASTGDDFDTTKCVPITGDKPAGAPCTYGGRVEATDDCDADSQCWPFFDQNGELAGVCTPFCSGTFDDPDCPGGGSCVIGYEGSLGLCAPLCDPLAQDCEPGLGCHFNPTVETFNCWVGQDGAGQACETDLDSCEAGQMCVSAEFLPGCADPACCTAFCDLQDPSCAAPGTTCVAMFEVDMAPAGAENVGLCEG